MHVCACMHSASRDKILCFITLYYYKSSWYRQTPFSNTWSTASTATGLPVTLSTTDLYEKGDEGEGGAGIDVQQVLDDALGPLHAVLAERPATV